MPFLNLASEVKLLDQAMIILATTSDIALSSADKTAGEATGADVNNNIRR